MPCSKCRSDFNVFNWKLKCGECSDKYCTKCLNKKEGVLYCEKCLILLRRPPDPVKLMELRSKDLQDYLNKHNISTYGLVEKQELVDLFCNKQIPVKKIKGVDKLTANFAGSVPNLRPQTFFNDLLSDINAAFPDKAPESSTSSSSSSRPPFPSNAPNNGATTQPPQQQSFPIGRPMRSNSVDLQQTTSSSSLNNLQKSPESSPIPRKYPKVSDYNNIEELSVLSVRELKLLLAVNRVDYKGCVEKSELLERVERLWNDNAKQKATELPDVLDDLCKLCMDEPLGCVLLECGHIATCLECGKKLAECPICRQYVSRVVRTFKA